jgi:hypothetical protein
MPDTTTPRCIAETQINTPYNGTHTLRCQLERGHDGMHERKTDTGRATYWAGPARKVEFNTNYRYGLRPGWQTR